MNKRFENHLSLYVSGEVGYTPFNHMTQLLALKISLNSVAVKAFDFIEPILFNNKKA
jgi:hypothetical protein